MGSLPSHLRPRDPSKWKPTPEQGQLDRDRYPDRDTLPDNVKAKLGEDIAALRDQLCEAYPHIALSVPKQTAGVDTSRARAPAHCAPRRTTANVSPTRLRKRMQGISVEGWVIMLNIDIEDCETRLDMLDKLLSSTWDLPAVRRTHSLARILFEANLCKRFGEPTGTANDLLSVDQKLNISGLIKKTLIMESTQTPANPPPLEPPPPPPLPPAHRDDKEIPARPRVPLQRERAEIWNPVTLVPFSATIENLDAAYQEAIPAQTPTAVADRDPAPSSGQDGEADADRPRARPLTRQPILPRHFGQNTLVTWAADEEMPQQVVDEHNRPRYCIRYTPRRGYTPPTPPPTTIFDITEYIPLVRNALLPPLYFDRRGVYVARSVTSFQEMVLDLVDIPLPGDDSLIGTSTSARRNAIEERWEPTNADDNESDEEEEEMVGEYEFDEDELEEYLGEFGELLYVDAHWPLHLANRAVREREQIVREFADVQEETHRLLAEATLLEAQVKRQQEVTRGLLGQATEMAGPGFGGLVSVFHTALEKVQEKERRMLARIRDVETRAALKDANDVLEDAWEPFVPTLEEGDIEDLMDVDAAEPAYFSDDAEDEHPVHAPGPAPFRAPLTEEQFAAQARYWEEGDPELSHVDLEIDAPLASEEELAEQQEYDDPADNLGSEDAVYAPEIEARLPALFMANAPSSPPVPSPQENIPFVTPPRSVRRNAALLSTPPTRNPSTPPRNAHRSSVAAGRRKFDAITNSARRTRSPRKRAAPEPVSEDSSEVELPRSAKKRKLEEDTVLSTLNSDVLPNLRKYRRSSERRH
ncbi:hypothetical protein C8Q75DRAFT_78120 [Abortiporus biennis]|nr:hypothetical protein C8Q75DRAFT_78120 [Abortiporus biennis]